MKKLKFSQISELLIQKGLLKKIVNKDGKVQTIATNNGNNYGIYNTQKISMRGQPYQVVIYNQIGQKYILALLKQVSTFSE